MYRGLVENGGVTVLSNVGYVVIQVNMWANIDTFEQRYRFILVKHAVIELSRISKNENSPFYNDNYDMVMVSTRK